MTRRPAIILLSITLVATPVASGAQSPGAAVRDGLHALTDGMGGCGKVASTEPVRLSFFPTVAFTRGSCFREHGDPTTALVGIDDDSVFYLASLPTLEFLRLRHPPVAITEQTVVTYARQALEIAGAESGRTTLLRSLADVPAEARDSVARANSPLFAVTSLGQRSWHVTLTFRELEGFYRPAIVQHELTINDDGSVYYVDTRVLWFDPSHQ